MKTNERMNTIAQLGLLVLLAAVVAGCASSRPYVTEERQFIQLHHVKNTGEELNLKKGDAVYVAPRKARVFEGDYSI